MVAESILLKGFVAVVFVGCIGVHLEQDHRSCLFVCLFACLLVCLFVAALLAYVFTMRVFFDLNSRFLFQNGTNPCDLHTTLFGKKKGQI